jgi:hypothetical protein
MKKGSLFLIAALGAALSLLGCSSDSGSGAGGEGGSAGGGGEEGAPGATISMSGVAWQFTLPGMGGYGRIAGATVSVLELPEISTTTNDEGEFTLEGVPVGTEATLVLEHDQFPLTYSKTHTVPEEDISDLTFQVPNSGLYQVIEIQLGIETDPDKCHMVSTFTRYGRTIGDPGHHGQAGAVMSIDFPDGASVEEGPIYFGDNVLPDRDRDYSSLDGGVLIVNADPGDYMLHADCVPNPSELYDDYVAEYPKETYPDEDLRCHDEEVEFISLKMKCRGGVFMNASPSYGLQALPAAEPAE